MLNRDYKQFGFGTISHIYNRGNNKEIIFRDEEDNKAFLFRLALALGFDNKNLVQNPLLRFPTSRIRITPAVKNDFKLHAFCLMPNHFHLIIEQCTKTSVSKILSRTCTSFSKYINKKYKRVGHVFQDEFKSVLIDSNHQLMWDVTYVHMNPIKARLVRKPEDYSWSSYRYFYNDQMPLLSKELVPEIFGGIDKLESETLLLQQELSKSPFDSWQLGNTD